MKNATIIFSLLTAAATIRALNLREQDIQNFKNLFHTLLPFEHLNGDSYECVTEPLVCGTTRARTKANSQHEMRKPEHLRTRMTNENLRQLFEMLVSWKIKIDEQRKNTSGKILVLGNSGVGISTFVQFIAGNNSKMISEEAGIGTEQYIIRDDNKIGSSLIESNTNHPEEVIFLQNISLVDIPGFSDSRNLTEDILVSTNMENYFENRPYNVDDIAKIVLLTEYYSVQHGMYKHNFINLLRNIYNNFILSRNLISNVNLIVVKVPNNYKMIKTNRQLISNEIIIANIADFIKRVKLSLIETLKRQSCDEYLFYGYAIQFINELLETDDNGNYKKINIFRQPDEPGLISNIQTLQENKKSLLETILYKIDQLSFVILLEKIDSTYEKFKSCTKETLDNNLQNTLEQLKIVIGQYNLTADTLGDSYLTYRNKSIDRASANYKMIVKLNEEIKNMYDQKFNF